MSGEAYNNLWLKDADELWQAQEPLERMAERLAGLGHADAAGETFAVLAEVRAQHARLEASLRRLSGVWRAVDYWDSSDAGPERVDEALEEYRKGDLRGAPKAPLEVIEGEGPSVRIRTVREVLDELPYEFGRTVPEVLADYEGEVGP